MRPLEIWMTALCLPPTLWLLIANSPLAGIWRFFAFCAAIAMVAHVLLEGPHWQLIPIYLAVLLLLFAAFRQPVRLVRTFAVALLLLLACGATLVALLPMFHLAKPTGPYPVGTRTEFLIDNARTETHPGARPGPREVVLQLWYPSATSQGKHAMYRRWRETNLRSSYQAVLPVDSLQDAPVAEGKFPVILFNHAWRGFRNRSTFLMQDLASHGFVVVSVAHSWNAATVELHDGYIADGRNEEDIGNFSASPPAPLDHRLTIAEAELKIQMADNRFALDKLEAMTKDPASPYAGRLDLTRVGTIGHSFGGATAIEMAKEDPRVLSALGLDGDVYGLAATEGVPKPVMMIEADAENIIRQWVNSPDPGTRIMAQMDAGIRKSLQVTFDRYGGFMATVRGLDHESFTDKGYFSPFRFLSGVGDMPEQRAGQIINQLSVAFFNQTLKGEPQPLLQQDQHQIPEVTIQVYRPPNAPAQTARQQ